MVGKVYLKKRNVYEYTYVSEVNGEKPLWDICLFVQVNERLRYVKALREGAGEMSNRYLVVAKLKLKIKKL